MNEHIKELKGYLSVRQVAEKLSTPEHKINKRSVNYLISSGKLSPVHRVDNYYVVHESTVEAFRKNRKNSKDGRLKIK